MRRPLPLPSLVLALLLVTAEPGTDSSRVAGQQPGGAASGPASIDVTVREGTSMSVAVSPDGRTLAVDLQGSIWTLPAAGGPADHHHIFRFRPVPLCRDLRGCGLRCLDDPADHPRANTRYSRVRDIQIACDVDWSNTCFKGTFDDGVANGDEWFATHARAQQLDGQMRRQLTE